MPQYEYICEDDGDVVVLLRPMADADRQVEDPEGRGRVFSRKLSVFGTQGGRGSSSAHVHSGPSCPCGKPQSQCGS